MNGKTNPDHGFTESPTTSSAYQPESTRKGPIRSAEERRKVNIPPPPGSPVRSGLDRRKGDRRVWKP